MNLGSALMSEVERHWPEGRPRLHEPASPASSDRGRLARMNAIEKAHGGPAGAAQVVGVSPETWRRWRKTGVNPRTGKPYQKPGSPGLAMLSGAAGALYAAARAAYIAARNQKIRKGLARVHNVIVTAIVRWDSYLNRKGDGTRTVKLGTLELDAMFTPWSYGDPDGAALTFEAAAGRAHSAVIQFEGDAVEVSWS